MEITLKGTVHYEVTDGIAVLTVDNPPVNPLSDGVRAGLFDGIAKCRSRRRCCWRCCYWKR